MLYSTDTYVSVLVNEAKNFYIYDYSSLIYTHF